jgi:4-amino-4-deoxy-L-arabinose transferase-like glycosyltransferase
MSPNPSPNRSFDATWLALLALAVAVYVFGLGGQYIPSNGDELVYTHIARLTAASNHWLPLVSELDHMRNTKPPLLLWQAMVAGDWGQHWNQAALRTPSLIYTFSIAGALIWTVHQITRQRRTAVLAACVYLAFFCTFRYGRAYLTSAPESFWLNLPMFCLLWLHLRPTRSTLGWLAHIGFGLAFGLGLAYKSFALIAPAAATLWTAQLLSEPKLSWRVTLQTSLKVSLSAAVALGVFGLWFVLDPDPAAVWQEFVIGENAGKLSSGLGYWHNALRGGSYSIWAHLLGYVENSGLLAFVTLGLAVVGLKAWRQRAAASPLPPHLVILLTWLAVWLLVFSLPSQRSARYVIPAMPALAMLLALYWERIARGWFLASLLLCGLFIGVLGRIAWAAHDIGIGSGLELGAALLVIAAGLALVVAGFLKPAWTRACTVAACLVFYASFGLTTAPLEGAAGQYVAQTASKLHQARVAVPSNFNAQHERFEFLLPGNQFVPYSEQDYANTSESAAKLSSLLATHDAVVWFQEQRSEPAPPCVPACTVLGTRWEITGRHRSGEVNLSNLWYPQTWLFRREWLVANTASPASRAPR